MNKLLASDASVVSIAMGGVTNTDDHTEPLPQRPGKLIRARDQALTAIAAATETLNRYYGTMGFPDSGGF